MTTISSTFAAETENQQLYWFMMYSRMAQHGKQDKGVQAITVQNPLSLLSDDEKATQAFQLCRKVYSSVLVGHPYDPSGLNICKLNL